MKKARATITGGAGNEGLSLRITSAYLNTVRNNEYLPRNTPTPLKCRYITPISFLEKPLCLAPLALRTLQLYY